MSTLLRDRLQSIVTALPDGASVTLPVAELREWLEHAGDGDPNLVFDLTVDDIAHQLGRTPACVRAWCRAGRVPGAGPAACLVPTGSTAASGESPELVSPPTSRKPATARTPMVAAERELKVAWTSQRGDPSHLPNGRRFEGVDTALFDRVAERLERSEPTATGGLKGDCPYCGKHGLFVLKNPESFGCNRCDRRGYLDELLVILGGVGEESEAEHRTDMGSAARFARLYGDQVRYVHAWGRWVVWDGKRWSPNDVGQVSQFAKATTKAMHREAVELADRTDAKKLSDWAFRSEAEAKLNAMISLARTESGIPILPEQLDADPWLFNVENGTIDLRTGELKPHAQTDLITKLAPVEYDPEATAPRWESFLLEIMDNRPALVSFLQRAYAYSMTGSTIEHVLLFLYGLGANGKSTLLNVLLALFGDYGRQSDPELLIRKRGEAHPTGVAALKGARLVVTSEIDAGRRMAESLVKQLTGGDRITARFMRQDFFEFEPSHTITLAANHRPVVKGTDTAIWRRIHLVPFDVTFPPERQDGDLPEKLKAELTGILNWLVQGCLEWQQVGLNPPPEVRAATDSYRDAMDVLGGFIAEHCIVVHDAEVEARDLYERYKTWSEVSGERKLAKNVFGQQLQERGFETYKHGQTRRVVYLGIGLLTGSEATRRNLRYDPIETPRVETNPEVASGTFAGAGQEDVFDA